jgi:hypothetical protein
MLLYYGGWYSMSESVAVRLVRERLIFPVEMQAQHFHG